MRNLISIASLLLTGLVLSNAASASDPVYKWTDSSGHSHYSQTPPEGQKYQTITPAGTVSSNGLPADSNSAVQTADSAKPDASKSSADNGPTPAEISRKKNCATAQANVNTLKTHATVTADVNGDGKPVTLNAAQHDAAMADANKQVNLYCAN